MLGRQRIAATPIAYVDRDSSWHEERRVEVLSSVAETERRTILSNVAGTLMIAAVSQLLPNADAFLFPVCARLAATAFMTAVYTLVRRRLAAGQTPRMPKYIAIAVGAFGGASWGWLLSPVFIEPVLHPASFFVAAGILIAVSLVASHSSPLPYVWYPFGIAFLATFWLLMLQAPEPFGLWMSIGVGLIYLSVATFSLGTARQRVDAAETLIDNHRLGEDLAEALARAEFLAVRDPLTGLYNRRAMFENDLPARAEGARNHLLLIDIDQFKAVNDRFGHDVGDRMLVAIGQVLQGIVRDLDGKEHFAARLGGEEFAIFLAIDSREEAEAIAERTRRAIADTARTFSLPEKLGTASIGLAAHDQGEPVGPALQRADNALYEAKRGGRDRVVAQAG